MSFKRKYTFHSLAWGNFSIFMAFGILVLGLNGMARADTINMAFNGNIKIASCTVDTGSVDQTVSLGTVGAAQFKTIGDRASPTQFAIKLGNCPPGTNGASITFSGAGDSHNSTVLALDSGGATGVGIELSDITGSKINLGTPSAFYGLVASGSNIMSFSARYVATVLPVTAGKGDASAQFTINYQ